MATMAGLEAITQYKPILGRLNAVLGEQSPSFLRDASIGAAAPAGMRILPALAGGAAGAILWKDHRVLGFLGGNSIGANAPLLLDGRYRREALCNMGQTGGGIAGSLMLPGRPIIGYLLGHLGVGALFYFGGFRR